MAFRNCLIGSVIFHIIFFWGMSIFQPDRSLMQSKETYLQIYTEPEGDAGSGAGAVALQSNARLLAKVRRVGQSKPVQIQQVKTKLQLPAVTAIKSVFVKQIVGNETPNQPLIETVTAKPVSREAVAEISNPVTSHTAKPDDQPGGSSLNSSREIKSKTGTVNAGTGTKIAIETGNGTGTGTGTESGDRPAANFQTHLPLVDVRPVKTYFPSQKYPRQGRRNNWEGKTVLLVIVQSDGRVGEVTVQSTSGHAILDREAIRAVKKWRFQPGLKDGKPVNCQVRIPFIFKLED